MSDAVWIRTMPTVDGKTYVVTLEASDDHAVTLTPDRALAYAHGLLAAAQRALYDAAVLRQLRTLGIGLSDVGGLMADLRADRPPIDDEATAPLRFEPGVAAPGKPFLHIYLDGKPVGQWSPAKARDHALGVIEAVQAADLDAGYYRLLVGAVGLAGPRARQVVEDIGEHRPDGIEE